MTLGDQEDRFVVLRHEVPAGSAKGSHWDWMFERGGVLATWCTFEWPGSKPVRAAQLPDHRTEYLDYEGPVSGNRGLVQSVARGRYQVREWSSERMAVTLTGEHLAGSCVFQRDADGEWWLSLSQSRKESTRRERP